LAVAKGSCTNVYMSLLLDWFAEESIIFFKLNVIAFSSIGSYCIFDVEWCAWIKAFSWF